MIAIFISTHLFLRSSIITLWKYALDHLQRGGDQVQSPQPRLHQEEWSEVSVRDTHELAGEENRGWHQFLGQDLLECMSCMSLGWANQKNKELFDHLPHLQIHVPCQVQRESICVSKTRRGGMPVCGIEWQGRVVQATARHRRPRGRYLPLWRKLLRKRLQLEAEIFAIDLRRNTGRHCTEKVNG